MGNEEEPGGDEADGKRKERTQRMDSTKQTREQYAAFMLKRELAGAIINKWKTVSTHVLWSICRRIHKEKPPQRYCAPCIASRPGDHADVRHRERTPRTMHGQPQS